VSAKPVNEFQRAFLNSVSRLTKDPCGALEVMFDLSAQRLVRLAMTVTKTQQDAEDALQAAFSRIAARPGLLARADLPWPYLIRTVRNEALRIVQKRRHSQLGSLDRAKVQQSAEDVFQQEETAEHVRRILATLPVAQYEVVILKHWEDLTFAEIAEALGKSQNTVASRYRYAMEKLQRSLEPIVRESVTESARTGNIVHNTSTPDSI
jgi:RNA polymerase sigma-70 factor (ECF subfamily)